jgi:hypothetical protein
VNNNGIADFIIGAEGAANTGADAVSGAGDVNDDGFDDLLIGAAGSSEAYFIYGGGAQLADFDLADGSADGTIDLNFISDVPFA